MGKQFNMKTTRQDAASTSQDNAPAGQNALEMRAVTKDYGSLRVLHPTDMTVGAHEFVTLLGPSGSGKSTILSIAAGITAPSGGQVIARGVDITDTAANARNIGMVFQRYTLFPNKSVFDNVAFPLKVRGIPASEKKDMVTHFLELVGLENQAHRFPAEISGGQAQRVALARALVFEPALLLMDEPLGALDRRLRQTLQEEIRRIQQETKVPTLYVTHDQEEAMSLSDRVLILRDGHVVADKGPVELYSNPPTLWSAQFLGDANARALEKVFEKDGQTWARTTCGVESPVRKAVEGTRDDLVMLVRPEDCVVVAEGETPAECAGDILPATVRDVTFLGPFRQMHIESDGGWTLKTLVSGDMNLAPGTRVSCGFRRGRPVLAAAD